MVSRVAVCRTDGLAEWTEPTLNEAFRYAHTHRRRRRDSTVELSRVGVASAVCIEFATSSRRLPTKIWKLNMLRIYPVELSCVNGVSTRLSVVVTQFTILQPICDWRRKLETGSRLTTGAFTPPTRRNRLRCRQFNCSDSSRLSPTSCEFNTHRRRDSTRQCSCVGVGGVYWALDDRTTMYITGPTVLRC